MGHDALWDEVEPLPWREGVDAEEESHRSAIENRPRGPNELKSERSDAPRVCDPLVDVHPSEHSSNLMTGRHGSQLSGRDTEAWRLSPYEWEAGVDEIAHSR